MTTKDPYSSGTHSTLIEEDENMAMPQTNRKSILSGLDEPRPALMSLIRKYGFGLLILLAIFGLGSYFLGGTSDHSRKQTFITLELPPPPQTTTVNQTAPVTNQATPPIPDDQD
ncbi:MAG: hypothetical protein HQL84_06090 [Magnetococcales bacterium]|nr:hypothetical protein [Magnetococcales bacterium]MBF0149601.1 hypothetical protein [Magnetococcales bacterium]MBF0172397.1 hypothetical protein [Magnetococcales bacterium]MBF0347871.1 hypothetical protein [Magnetococcales bacterium]MBF0631068.1 hypothetical protein [Magnetococcales bacterium]